MEEDNDTEVESPDVSGPEVSFVLVISFKLLNCAG